MTCWRNLTAGVAALMLLTILAGGAGATSRGAAAAFDPTCGKARTASRTINGTIGSVTMQGTPTRIVALEFSFVDDLGAIGIQPVGIADDNDRNALLALAREFESVGDQALEWDGDNKAQFAFPDPSAH